MADKISGTARRSNIIARSPLDLLIIGGGTEAIEAFLSTKFVSQAPL